MYSTIPYIAQNKTIMLGTQVLKWDTTSQLIKRSAYWDMWCSRQVQISWESMKTNNHILNQKEKVEMIRLMSLIIEIQESVL